MLDPIADKLLIASALLLLAANNTIINWNLWAAILILCREILVSGLREYLGNMQISLPVSRLAKYKTACQMIALIFLLTGSTGDKILYLPMIDQFSYFLNIGIFLLWLSTLLSLITGWNYISTGTLHLIKKNSS